MKLKLIKVLTLFLLVFSVFEVQAQKPKSSSRSGTAQKHPASFTISKSEFDNLFLMKEKDVVVNKNNKYLDKSSVLMNTLNGDMKFLKIKLDYFKNAFLMVQVNGEYSTQIFILSGDKSVFYKGSSDKGAVIMTKCNEDDIVSE